ncbi:hypothetical protein FRC06_000666 [Ceratobasidium sp. 370]|nr:hypothetical protein FRC06_000666 [Ceratobasidium sp. 370]
MAEESPNDVVPPNGTPINDYLLHVNHGATGFDVALSPTNSIDDLKQRLYELTSVPVDKQKLFWKGMKRGGVVLGELGLKNGSKITLVGASEGAIQSMHRAEAEASRRAEIMRNREARGPTKVRDTPASSTKDAQFRFHRIEPLSHLPNPIQARSTLSKLANDPAILHVMRLHRFSVGLLTELAPHEHPDLLGLNVNGGQTILLRIRTNAYDGFRTYGEIRRVLCHELAHNVYNGHGDDFKTLNSQLNREVAEFERSVQAGSNTLSDSADTYDDRTSNVQREAAVQAFVLGGGTNLDSPRPSDSREERRQRILAAAVARLEQEEREIEDRCRG